MAKIKLWQWAIIQIVLVWGVCFGFIFWNVNTALNVTTAIIFLYGLAYFVFLHLNKKAANTKDGIAEQRWFFAQSICCLSFTIIAFPFMTLLFIASQFGPWYVGFAISIIAFSLLSGIPINTYINKYYGWQASLDKVLKLQEKEKLA